MRFRNVMMRCPLRGSTDQETCKTLRVTMVIDHLGSGGAERQFCMLAKDLTQRGIDVEVVVFQPGEFSAPELQESGVPIVSLQPRNLVHLIFLMRNKLRSNGTDVVIAFLKWSSLLVELAGLPWRDFVIISSERSLDLSGTRLELLLRYSFHYFADAVVCNSFAQQKQIRQQVPLLTRRLKVFLNGVDLDYFKPNRRDTRMGNTTLRLLVLARYSLQKNPFGLLEAVTILRAEHPELDILIDWYGHVPSSDTKFENWLSPHRRSVFEASAIHSRLRTAIAERRLQKIFRLHAVRKDVLELYHETDVVCVPSFYEGCSNVIGEALACGVPVLASRVSDNGRLIRDGITGFLFDPSSPREIADAIMRFATLPASTVRNMTLEGRRVAERELSPTVLGVSFVGLIADLLSRENGIRP